MRISTSSSCLSYDMEEQTQQKIVWSAVPQFGDWETGGQPTDYSVVFSRARENRKQHKNDVGRSLGNEKEIMVEADHHHHHPQREGCQSPRRKNKKILTFFTDCMRPR